jgi:protein TonB
MRSLRLCAVLCLLSISAVCQQTDPSGTKHDDSSVQAPTIEHAENPEIPAGQRSPKGVHHVLISVIVDKHGNPTHVKVKQPAGYGFDEKAVEAVMKYKFKPAMRNGSPVKTDVTIDVKFETF